MIFVLFFLLSFGCASTEVRMPSSGADRYANYAELSKFEREGVDYRVRVYARPSKTAVLVIHGGAIEEGSSQIGDLLMQDKWSGYFFEGLKAGGNHDLHITSARFDEPRAEDLVRDRTLCVSVHGFNEVDRSMLCLGGRHEALIRRVRDTKPATLDLEIASCDSIGGISPLNIVNRCGMPARPGLQLELSTRLRERLLKDPKAMRVFTDWIRSSVDAQAAN
jgi:phage replication-related protein YjqB (UPF0714/DUF867 family)